MKKLIFLLFALFAPLSLVADAIQWAPSWDEAVAKALKEDKKMMVLMTSERCRFCIRMEEEVFANDAIAFQINEEFVPLKYDISNEPYPPALRVRGTPTIYFIPPKDPEAMEQVVGYRGPMQFMQILHQVK